MKNVGLKNYGKFLPLKIGSLTHYLNINKNNTEKQDMFSKFNSWLG